MIAPAIFICLGLALWGWSGDRLVMAGNIHRPPRDRDILKFYGIVLRVAGVFITASGAVWLIRAGLAVLA